MRDILFRGKRIDNGEWVEGSLLITEILGGTDYEILKRNRGTWQTSYRVDPITIGQFTGLTDKNGIRVWEGDIMALNVSRKFVVCYDKGIFYMNGTSIPIRHCDSLTVVGNIHDNPELMEGE